MRTPDPSGTRAVLIGVHTGCQSLGLGDLPGVERNMAELRQLLTNGQTWRLPPDNCLYLSQPKDEWTVLQAVETAASQATDTLLVYIAGHGLLVGREEKLYFALPEAPADDLCLAYEKISRRLRRRRPPRTVVILDCCYSGQVLHGEMGAPKSSAMIGRLVASKSTIEGVCVLTASAATRPALAPDGDSFTAFTGALIHVLSNGIPGGAEFLDMTAVYGATKEYLACHHPEAPEPQLGTRGDGGRIVIARNPACPPADTTSERRQAEDLDSHFKPRALGLENGGQVGHYFGGRTEILTELAGWLRGDLFPERRLTVVTGEAGVGKSAILSRLVVLSNPDACARIPAEALNADHRLPAGTVTVAVHARRKTLDEIVAILASAANSSATTPSGLMESLQVRNAPFVAVLDAIDEAGTTTGSEAPRAIVRDLLLPLANLSCVRLLASARNELLRVLTQCATERFGLYDLCNVRWTRQGDIKELVARLLESPIDPGSHTIRPRGVREEISDAIARRVSPNVLAARLIAHTIAGYPNAIDTHSSRWEDRLPSSLSEAFSWSLDAMYGSKANRVRRMLLPLALAEGDGLPWRNIWPALATSLSGRPITNSDIRQLLESGVGRYVVELQDPKGASIYRLFHQCLADDLLRSAPQDSQLRLSTALTETVPLIDCPDGVSRCRDWSHADPYVIHHLLDHAAAAANADSLLADVDFIVHAEPSTLARNLAYARISDAVETTRVVRTSFPRFAELPDPAMRRSVLAIDAVRHQSVELATRAGQIQPRLTWQPSWATNGETSDALIHTLRGHGG
ncbi:MAG TPA: hypothetical protein DGT23_07865, partial [Micromonosporaceae bacterium]|nr:hypothetical protein [Micromonosporaceae bacterium]